MKEKMIAYEKEKLFNQHMYQDYKFSDEEITKLKEHKVLNKMFDKMEIETKLKFFKDPYANMVSNIIYQQVAFKLARYSEVMLFDYLDYEITPEKILSLSNKDFNKFKITGRRIDYIRNFTQFVIDNPEFWSNVYNVDEEELDSTLVTISGVGKWTIEMFKLFALANPNIISLGDLIIVRGIENLYGPCSKEELNKIVDEIEDFATIASVNLWKYIEQGYYLVE